MNIPFTKYFFDRNIFMNIPKNKKQKTIIRYLVNRFYNKLLIQKELNNTFKMDLYFFI